MSWGGGRQQEGHPYFLGRHASSLFSPLLRKRLGEASALEGVSKDRGVLPPGSSVLPQETGTCPRSELSRSTQGLNVSQKVTMAAEACSFLPPTSPLLDT